MQNTKLILNGGLKVKVKVNVQFFRKERYVMCDNCFKLGDFVYYKIATVHCGL